MPKNETQSKMPKKMGNVLNNLEDAEKNSKHTEKNGKMLKQNLTQ